MLTNSKVSFSALAAISALALSACASQAPRVSNATLGYAVTNYAIAADSDEENLSSALGSALSSVGIATAMPAKAEVSIDFVRYNSPIIGFFYGGEHYASLSVVLMDSSGSKITSFPLYVAANGDRASADADLAGNAASVIAAKAANAFRPMKAMAKAAPKPLPVAEPVAVAAPVIAEPVIEIVQPEADTTAPCVIGPDGKCLVL